LLVISIDPVAFSIGTLQVRWYGIMVAMAVITLLAITFRETKKRGVSETTTIYNLLFWALIGGIIGAKLVYFVEAWSLYGVKPSDIISPYGWALYGAILGSILAGLIYWRIRPKEASSQNLPAITDAVAVGAPLAQAIGRIGCTINGCCYGKPSPFLSFPGAVSYTPRDTIPAQYWNIPLYPTQIYFVLWSLIVFAIVWKLRRRPQLQGSLLFLYLSLYAVGDFGLRFFKAAPPVLTGLRGEQIISLVILAIALPVLIIRIHRFQQKATAEPADNTTQQQNQED